MYQNPRLKECPTCSSTRLHYMFSIEKHRTVKCENCGIMLLNPQPSNAELAEKYTEGYFLNTKETALLKSKTAELYLEKLKTTGKLLEIGCGDGYLLEVAEQKGWEVTGVEYSADACEKARQKLKRGKVQQGELIDAKLPENHYDACIIADVIEHVRDIRSFLTEIHRVLKPNGALVIATPSTDSWSARLMRDKWMEFKPEHLTYFNSSTLRTALFNAGFINTKIESGWKILNIEYIRLHFEKFQIRGISPLVRTLCQFLPTRLQKIPFKIVASGIVSVSQKGETPKNKISVIVAAYNEENTIKEVVDTILAKKINNLETELILVESGSTDTTRDIIKSYADCSNVKIVLQDTPKGKGNAIRAGLKVATGEYILIQDADLEYDFEDYDPLLEPLLSKRKTFVLGARHGGKNIWKLRQFDQQKLTSTFLNLGHIFFATLVNVLFMQKLRDPFTMYKVFRRDCIDCTTLVCNKFDFDYELLIKIIRNGHQPIEIPVNYKSRSFKEGKKVNVISDPINWLITIAKLRLNRL